jgi:serine/threonine-protein kinase
MQKTWGLIVGAAGIAGLGVGSYFGVQALSASSHAKETCPNAACAAPGAVQQNNDAKTDARIADVGFAVGVGGLVAGSLLYFLAPRSAGVSVAPVVGRTSGIVAQKSW